MPNKQSKLQNLKVTVMSQTAEYLKKTSAVSGITMGEIIDKLCLKLTAHEPAMAAELILEDFVIHIQNMEDQEVFETIALVLSSIRKILGSGMPGNIRQTIEDINEFLEQ